MPKFVKKYYGPEKLKTLPGYIKLTMQAFGGPDASARFYEWEPIPDMPPACAPVKNWGTSRKQYRQSMEDRLKKHIDKGQALSLLEGLKNDTSGDAEKLRGMIKNRIKKI